ncbi:uncharacterized protein VTP21DRAFT_2834 [Calcarisporiella thermophila]|uniref:uncharacterized protein n=1 Tax=Calcarisporiella thermophila TaxID=911321 RepID=UPI0037442C60
MLRILPQLPRITSHHVRCFSACPTLLSQQTNTLKPNLKLLSKLRQETEVSMTKAKEALVKNDNDYERALAWLQEDMKLSGAKKAEKVSGRVAGEGLVGVVVAEGPEGSRGAIVEVNCETDFVSRNEVFKKLVTQISSTALFASEEPSIMTRRYIAELPVDTLLTAPILPHPNSTEIPESLSVSEGMAETVGRLGEKITLRRAAVAKTSTQDRKIVSGVYAHGGDQSTGNIGSLVVLGLKNTTHSPSDTIKKLARNLARQVVGFNPKCVRDEDAIIPDGVSKEEYLSSSVLLRQDYLLGGGSVQEIVASTSAQEGVEIEVLDFVRWEKGEGIEKKENNFVEEVKRQMQGN